MLIPVALVCLCHAGDGEESFTAIKLCWAWSAVLSLLFKCFCPFECFQLIISHANSNCGWLVAGMVCSAMEVTRCCLQSWLMDVSLYMYRSCDHHMRWRICRVACKLFSLFFLCLLQSKLCGEWMVVGISCWTMREIQRRCVVSMDDVNIGGLRLDFDCEQSRFVGLRSLSNGKERDSDMRVTYFLGPGSKANWKL